MTDNARIRKLITSSLPKVLLLALLIFSTLAVILPSRASALSGSDFDAGRIIDDGIFYNENSMSAAQIQQFLNAKLPTCDTWGTQPYGGTTRAAYAASKGVSTPFICLKDYTQEIPAVINSGSDLCQGSIAAGQKSAAQIISDVSKACGVNPQVLIVLLQKEQSLITDDWPWPIQYRSATGYGCPDTAPCDSEFYGFFNQVYQAAKGYKRYQANPANYNYRAGRNNTILWNPTISCGSSSVYIENQATAGLYIYTPYRPNQAALNNLYGTGDGCSSYGNRNFWRMFNDWFGTTYAGAYHAKFVEQSPHPVIKQGEKASAYVRFKNVGNSAWHDDIGAAGTIHKPVRLATDLPLNRNSQLGSTWKFPHRPGINFARVYGRDGNLTPNQHIAYPGETVEFWFAFSASYTTSPGTYTEGYRLIIEGAGPMNDTGTYLRVEVKQTVFSAGFAGQSSFPTIKQGQSAPAHFMFKNTGNVAWYDNVSAWSAGKPPVRLGTDAPLNRLSIFGSNWTNGKARPVRDFAAVYEADGVTLAANQHVVQPGQIGKFAFEFTVPQNTAPGYYPEVFRPIVEGVGPMNETGTWLGVTVQ